MMRSGMIFAVLAAAGCDSALSRDPKVIGGDRIDEPRAQAAPETAAEETGSFGSAATEKPETVTPPLEVEDCEPGSWTVELVDGSSRTERYSALALDSYDRPHLTYEYEMSLRYAHRTDMGVWEFETVNLEGVGAYTALAVGDDGQVHVGVQVGNIGYTVRGTDGIWEWHELVPSSPLEFTSGTSSIALGANGGRHISFYLIDSETNNLAVIYVHWSNEEALMIEPVATAGDAADYSSIAVDATGAAHLTWNTYYYGNPGRAEVYYARQIEDLWAIELVESRVRRDKLQPSLALDSDGGVHLAYASEGVTTPTTWYAYRTSGGWEIETIDSAGIKRPSIVAESDGTVHVSFFDATLGRVRYARREAGTWGFQDIISEPTGATNSIALGTNGTIHAALYAAGVRYATRCP